MSPFSLFWWQWVIPVGGGICLIVMAFVSVALVRDQRRIAATGSDRDAAEEPAEPVGARSRSR